MGGALLAIVLVSAEDRGSLRPSDRRGVAFALPAGLGFGLFLVALSHTGDDSGLWPLVAARAASVTTVGSRAFLGRVSRAAPGRGAWALTAAALDAAANVFYLLASREGLLSVVSVLTALSPVSTVLLARIVLKERFGTVQRVGMTIAVPAAILMASGRALRGSTSDQGQGRDDAQPTRRHQAERHRARHIRPAAPFTHWYANAPQPVGEVPQEQGPSPTGSRLGLAPP